VDHYISVLSCCPPKTVIADLGCGDATLAKALLPKGINVLSYDLVSVNQLVTEADICGTLPLPGVDQFEDGKGSGDGQVVDIAVCALSLMATNWPNCIKEIWRVLRPASALPILGDFSF
jgi:ribosomal RNA-processing protein 8